MGKNEFSSKNDMNLKQQWEQVTMCKDSAYYDGVINIPDYYDGVINIPDYYHGVINIPDYYYINYVTIIILTM